MKIYGYNEDCEQQNTLSQSYFFVWVVEGMKQEWKAIKITAGKEERVQAALDELGIRSFAPILTIKERRRGEWVETKQYLLPGYILIYIN